MIKQLSLYIGGLFLLAIGVTFFIFSNTGVPPIASFPYAITLITNQSIGLTMIFAQLFFILVQIILLRKVKFKNIIIQLAITILIGFFFDFATLLLSVIPEAQTLLLKIFYLTIGSLLTSIAILLYFSANLPMNPYDTLTRIVTHIAKRPFGIIRVYCDVSVVLIALSISLIGLQAMGSVGVGTLIGSYTIGKIAGLLLLKFQPPIQDWIFAKSKEGHT